jgi:hypothetical protein
MFCRAKHSWCSVSNHDRTDSTVITRRPKSTHTNLEKNRRRHSPVNLAAQPRLNRCESHAIQPDRLVRMHHALLHFGRACAASRHRVCRLPHAVCSGPHHPPGRARSHGPSRRRPLRRMVRWLQDRRANWPANDHDSCGWGRQRLVSLARHKLPIDLPEEISGNLPEFAGFLARFFARIAISQWKGSRSTSAHGPLNMSALERTAVSQLKSQP